MNKISILIPIFNKSDLTRNCILSLFKTTKLPIELIIINNASTDDSLEILEELKKIKPNNITDFKIINNKKNEGVLFTFNQGIDLFTGDYILFQNNDCIFTEECIDKMLNVLKLDENIGITGPLTNLFHGTEHPHPQLIAVPYKDLTELEDYTKSLNYPKNKYTSADYIFGHSMLVKRSVIDKVGKFDKRFGMGYFEEIDYCKRAKLLGFKVVVTNNAFIHHIGNQTLDLLNINRDKLKEKNRQIFNKKWNVNFQDIL